MVVVVVDVGIAKHAMPGGDDYTWPDKVKRICQSLYTSSVTEILTNLLQRCDNLL